MDCMTIRNVILGVTAAAALLAADPAIEQARKKIAAKQWDEAIAQLEGANRAKPSAEVKKALIDAHMAKGDFYMNDQGTPPRVKYPTALKSYREVLKLDKDNAKAKQNIATIEGIYKSMGRPVPQ